MNEKIENKLAISYYKEIGSLNQAHRISLVQHTETNRVFVKKMLRTYSSAVYRALYNNPIQGIPHIEALYEDNDYLIVIEEYISGQSLLDMLSSNHAFTEEAVISIAIQLCDIVAKLHSLEVPIIHRDIKPSNVILTTEGRVYLIDLNAAKFVDKNKTEDTILLGTQGYAAPEQYGFGPSTIKTDIYSIGILMNTLITNDPKVPIDRSCILFSVINKCTQINPEQRFRSVISLKQALLSLSQNRTFTDTQKESWMIPGFRSRTPLNMIVSIIGYIALASLSFGLKTAQQTTIAIALYEKIMVFFSLIATVFFACDYRGIHHRLPLCHSENKILRVIGISIFSIILWFCLFLVIIMIEVIVF